MALKVTNRLLPTDGWQAEYDNYCTGKVTTSSGGLPNAVGTYKSIDSVYDGKFTKGVFRVNPVTIRKVESYMTAGGFNITWNSCNYTILSGTWLQSLVGFNLDPTSATASWNQNIADQSLIRAYNKCSDADLQLGVMIGELKETIQMLRNPIRELLTLVKKPGLRNLSNTWLSYRYGIRPLLKDIDDAIKLIKKSWNSGNNLRRSSGTMSAKQSSTSSSAPQTMNRLTFTPVTDTVTETKAVSTIYYRFVNSSLSKLEQLGLSPADVLGIAWELVPLSFVADWFIRIAAWLNAIRPVFGVQYLGNCTSLKTVMMTKISPVAVKPAIGYDLKLFTPSEIVWKETKLVRRVNQSLPVLPPVNLDYRSFLHVIDSTALVSQRLGKVLKEVRVKPSKKREIFYLLLP